MALPPSCGDPVLHKPVLGMETDRAHVSIEGPAHALRSYMCGMLRESPLVKTACKLQLSP